MIEGVCWNMGCFEFLIASWGQIVDVPQPSLLDPRELTAGELAAQNEAARPGVWAGEHGADLRQLTQDETDVLIRAELCAYAEQSFCSEYASVVQACGGVVKASVHVKGALLHVQRGGIDSDPLVRLLAYRAWGGT